MEYNNNTFIELLQSRIGKLEIENLQLHAVLDFQQEKIKQLEQNGKEVEDGLQNHRNE